jgi:hypothetical protein
VRPSIQYWFSTASPWTWLGSTRFAELARHSGDSGEAARTGRRELPYSDTPIESVANPWTWMRTDDLRLDEALSDRVHDQASHVAHA